MIFAVTGIDGPNGRTIRNSDIRPEHLAHLQSLGDQIKMAGPILNEDGQPTGSLLIIEAETEEDIKAIIARDPYSIAGLFENISITTINPILGSWLK